MDTLPPSPPSSYSNFGSYHIKNTLSYGDNPAVNRVKMSDLTRNEMQSNLDANKAEVNAVASSMRAEMADFRTFQTQQFSEMKSVLSEIKGEITGLNGHISGMKTSVSSTQWLVVGIIALLTLLLAYPPIQRYINSVETHQINRVSPQQQDNHQK